MEIRTWRVARFRDLYGLCKERIQSYNVEFWSMWDMLLTHCETVAEMNIVRIDFITDGYLPTPLFGMDEEEFDYNCLFNLIIETIRRECLSRDNWVGDELYVDMSR